MLRASKDYFGLAVQNCMFSTLLDLTIFNCRKIHTNENKRTYRDGASSFRFVN